MYRNGPTLYNTVNYTTDLIPVLPLFPLDGLFCSRIHRLPSACLTSLFQPVAVTLSFPLVCHLAGLKSTSRIFCRMALQFRCVCWCFVLFSMIRLGVLCYLFFMEVELSYNSVLVLGEQHSDSTTIGIRKCLLVCSLGFLDLAHFFF